MCKTRVIIVCAIIALVCAVLSQNALAQPQEPDILRVDGDNGSEYGNGSGWGDDAFLDRNSSAMCSVDTLTEPDLRDG